MPITVAGLGHRFADQEFLFRGLDVEFSGGVTYAITGPSGSGKSTLLSLLAKWVKPTEGDVIYNNVEKVGWVFQNPFGVPGRKAIDHVALPLIAKGELLQPARERAMALLDTFKLSEVANRPFRALSGGEAQRLMLARAIAAQPDLLLVDEPTAQLDTHTAATVSQSLTQLSDFGTIIIVATHDPNTRDACAEHIDLSNYSRCEPGILSGE